MEPACRCACLQRKIFKSSFIDTICNVISHYCSVYLCILDINSMVKEEYRTKITYSFADINYIHYWNADNFIVIKQDAVACKI